ncbi:MAG: hypothetical protein ABR588_04160 [Sphingomicrobium sp.]|nr:hypothetical protein [Sphingomonadales bacterium]
MTEKDGVQRIRIGLTGLAFVFLLVLLGTVISRSSRDSTVLPNAAANAQNAAEPSDPLSDLGVAPGSSADGNKDAISSTAR